MYQAIIFLLSALLCIFAPYLLRHKRKAADAFLKSLTVLYCLVGFFRFMLSDSFLCVINGGWFDNVYYEDTDILQSILRWGLHLSYSVLPMAVFFRARFFRNIASYFCLPLSLLSAFFFEDFMVYFLSPDGKGLDLFPALRYAYFIFELVLAISIPILMQIINRHHLHLKDPRECRNLLFGLPVIALLGMPPYIPQSFFGYNTQIPKTFGTEHLIWIALLFLLTLALYYLFRFRTREERHMLCMFLTLLLFFHYNSLYLMGFMIKRLPFQLCNIAAYFYLIAMVFKMRRMFHFCFLANIVGTLIAILMPDLSVGTASFWNMHYVLEHSLVLLVPALVMGLRIFPRVSLKSLLYFFIGFTAYFLFAFGIGTVLNGYADVTGERVNYFFMFDLDMAFDYFPFLKFIEDYHYVFGRFEVYPVLILIIYAAFTLLSVLFYFLVKVFYRLEDDHLELRRSSIDLLEKITHRTSRRPKEFIE